MNNHRCILGPTTYTLPAGYSTCEMTLIMDPGGGGGGGGTWVFRGAHTFVINIKKYP